jgi:hypothetical protein
LEDLLKGGGVFGAADFDLDGADGFCGAEGEADLRGCGGGTIHDIWRDGFVAELLDGGDVCFGGIGRFTRMEVGCVAALEELDDRDGGVCDQHGGDFRAGEFVGGDGDCGADVDQSLNRRGNFRWLNRMLHDISAA